MIQFLQKKIVSSLYSIVAIGFFLFVLNGCKEKELKAMEKIIKSSKDVELFFVGDTPVNPLEQTTDKIYLCDYEVSSQISISKEQSDSIKTALLDTTNYMYDVEKKCMMMAKYAMRLTTKNDTLDIVLSDNPCAKAIASSSLLKNPTDEEGEKGTFYIDLTSDNTLLQTIKEILALRE